MNNLSGLDPRLRPYAEYLLARIRAVDPGAVVTSTRRTYAEQKALYDRWKAGLSKYPAAVPGTSDHELGLAFDIVADDAVLEAAGALWESMGGRWGGRFKDPIHFGVRKAE